MLYFRPVENARIARALLGEPNRTFSKKHELRFGTHGSMSVDLIKGLYHDFENGEGGSLFQLIKREKGYDDRGAFKWLESQGININGNGGYSWEPRLAPTKLEYTEDPLKGIDHLKININSAAPKQPPFHIVKTWQYHDENGAELFEVCRQENGETGDDGKAVKSYRQRRRDASQPGRVNGHQAGPIPAAGASSRHSSRRPNLYRRRRKMR
jgi:hypothetical protein